MPTAVRLVKMSGNRHAGSQARPVPTPDQNRFRHDLAHGLNHPWPQRPGYRAVVLGPTAVAAAASKTWLYMSSR